MNQVRITLSYLSSRIGISSGISGMPISVSIEPTTSCNLRCPECPSGLRSFSRPTGMLEAGLFKNIINQIASTTTYLTFYFQGEPYLHPEFTSLVEYASQRGLYTATSTNAHYLTRQKAEETVRSGLDRLIISIDGTDQKTYSAYRIGGSLQKVLEGTQQIVEARSRLNSRTPAILWQFLVVRPNEHQIDTVTEMAARYRVDKVAFKTAQLYAYESGNELMPHNPKYARYVQQPNGSYKVKNELNDHCWKMWNSCVITWDGKVIPCCFDKDAHHVLGQINTNAFEEIWHSATYDRFRKQVMKSRNSIEMCQNCTEGTRIWA